MIEERAVCCQMLSSEAPQQSPFGRAIAFGFFDGPTSGVVECSVCGRSHRYDLVAWDANQEWRAFMFEEVEAGVFARVVAICSQLGVPRWPVWVPLFTDVDDAQRAKIDRDIDQALGGKEGTQRLVVADGLETEILAAWSLAVIGHEGMETAVADEIPRRLGERLAQLGRHFVVPALPKAYLWRGRRR